MLRPIKCLLNRANRVLHGRKPGGTSILRLLNRDGWVEAACGIEAHAEGGIGLESLRIEGLDPLSQVLLFCDCVSSLSHVLIELLVDSLLFFDHGLELLHIGNHFSVLLLLDDA